MPTHGDVGGVRRTALCTHSRSIDGRRWPGVTATPRTDSALPRRWRFIGAVDRVLGHYGVPRDDRGPARGGTRVHPRRQRDGSGGRAGRRYDGRALRIRIRGDCDRLVGGVFRARVACRRGSIHSARCGGDEATTAHDAHCAGDQRQRSYCLSAAVQLRRILTMRISQLESRSSGRSWSTCETLRKASTTAGSKCVPLAATMNATAASCEIGAR